MKKCNTYIISDIDEPTSSEMLRGLSFLETQKKSQVSTQSLRFRTLSDEADRVEEDGIKR